MNSVKEAIENLFSCTERSILVFPHRYFIAMSAVEQLIEEGNLTSEELKLVNGFLKASKDLMEAVQNFRTFGYNVDFKPLIVILMTFENPMNELITKKIAQVA